MREYYFFIKIENNLYKIKIYIYNNIVEKWNININNKSLKGRNIWNKSVNVGIIAKMKK